MDRGRSAAAGHQVSHLNGGPAEGPAWCGPRLKPFSSILASAAVKVFLCAAAPKEPPSL
jgi:hypothetical protein